VVAAGLSGAYLTAAWQDLRRRTLSLLPLLLLTLVAVGGHSVLWWVLVGVTLAWPGRPQTLTALLPVLFVVGWATGEVAPVLALTAGILAFALQWWGGADSALLAILALRYGWFGLLAGAVTSVVFGLLFLAARRQLSRLRPVVAAMLAAQTVFIAGPGNPASELPAAVPLACVGVILELGLAAGWLTLF
jgi:Flp pilus assembly protein protease CpaA